ncbi:hypothetical protein DIPPA_30264 [Diplonema papillatum]|nr:hypothetical protein DIPPA_30264 [Diplonema papillatum]
MGCCFNLDALSYYAIVDGKLGGGDKSGIVTNVACFEYSVPASAVVLINEQSSRGHYAANMTIYGVPVRYDITGSVPMGASTNPPPADVHAAGGVNPEAMQGKPSNHEVISRAAFDMNVPASQVLMVRMVEGRGWGKYVLSVNGVEVRFNKMGSVYMSAAATASLPFVR